MIKLGGKQTLVPSVSIIKLQINCKISLKEAVWQLKVKKKMKKNYIWWKEKDLFFGLVDLQKVRKPTLRTKHSQQSAKLHKLLWCLLPTLWGCHKWMVVSFFVQCKLKPAVNVTLFNTMGQNSRLIALIRRNK